MTRRTVPALPAVPTDSNQPLSTEEELLGVDLLDLQTATAGVDMSGYSDDQLMAELARGLSLTADTLMRLALVWAEAERRASGRPDLQRRLDALRHGLARTLPLIAAGRLAAQAVVAFAGRAALLRALEGVSIARQLAFAAGEPVQVIDPADPAAVQEMPLASLPAAAFRLVFADGEVRSPEAQRLALRPRQRAPKKEGNRYQPRYDPETGTVRVGKMTVRLADLMAELVAAAGPELPAILRPEEWVAVKVRLTPGEQQKLAETALRLGLPDWELARKALRAFGLI